MSGGAKRLPGRTAKRVQAPGRKAVLKRLADSIPWQSFHPLLERGYTQERKSNAGHERIDPLVLFKILVLQQLFNLSDEQLEFQLDDRRSFEVFVALDVMNSIPNATTVAFLRERLGGTGLTEELFEMFDAYLHSLRLLGNLWATGGLAFAEISSAVSALIYLRGLI